MHQHAALNRCFRVVWNDTTGTFVAVAENARGRGKASGGSRARLLLAATAGLGLMAGAALAQAPPAATALPVGAQVKAGNVSLQQGGSTLTVQQASQRAVIDWQRFDIGADATVRFVQPDAHSVALNRVLANDPTQINGRLQANGQVFVLNNAGVVFGQGARVDVGGLVASSLGLSDSDFLAGNLRFSSNGAAGAVRNAGQLRAAPGGYVALLGPQVSNAGSISAAQGSVALAAGQQVSLALEGSGLVAVRVDQGALQAQIDNAGQIRADDGSVLLTARAADSLTRAAINHGGLIEANSLTARGGRIVLEADAITLAAGSSTQAVGATGGGQVLVGGDWQGSGPLRQASSVALEAGASIDVSASVRGDGGRAVLWSDLGNAQGNTLAQGQISARSAGGGQGGSVETSGHQVRVDGRVDAGRGGQWLLDPSDINVATLGGTVTPLAIQTSLNAGTNVTLDSSSGSGGNGDITVTNNIASTGTSAGALTLLASRDINIKANITLTGTGKALVLNAQRNLLFDNASTDPTLTTNGGNVVVAARSAGAATGNILVNTSTSLAIATAGGQVTLGGGDAAGSGYAIGSATDNALRMGVGAKENLSINSGGGNIAIRGQAGSFNAAGTGVDSYGVGVTGTSAINSGAGTINIDGKSANSGAGDNNMAVLFNGAANITSANTSANAIRIVGDATGAAGGDLGWGVVFFNTANSVTATAAGGSILIQGTRGVGVGADNTNDVYIAGAQLLGVSGNIDVLGTTVGGQLAFGQGRMIFGATTLSPSTITSSTSNVRLRFDKFNFLSIVPDVNTMGTFTWEPVGNGFAQALRVDQLDYNQYDTTTSRRLAGYTMGKDTGATTYGSNTVSADYALTVDGPISIYGGPVTVSRNLTSATAGQILIRSSSLTLGTSKLSSAGELKIETDALATPIGIAGAAGSFQVPASYFSTNFVDGFSQITIGRADGSGKITSAAVAPLDHLRLLNSSGGIELTGLVNLGANRLTLAGGGATTDTGSGQITAASLLLQGGGNVTLDNTSNSVATLAGSTGSLTYYNAGAMTIGSVNGVGGISASGVVDVATQSGDLTLSQAATTTNATASAMALNAGRSAAAGSAAGGNLVVSGGSVAVGSGGTAKLYTGSVASSTGLTALVGSGSGRFRYNSDEVSTNYSTALATGVAAIYRERPSASVTLNNASSIYGDALPTLTSTNAGLVNGDLPSLAAGGQLFSTAGKLRAGTYATTATGLAELGYNVTTVAGSLQVNRKVISASGAGVNNKVYDNTTAATINSAGSLSGAIAGDLLAATYSSASFADKNVGNAKTVTLTGGSLSGTDAANYSLASSTATATANITPKALTASGFSASNKVSTATPRPPSTAPRPA